MGKSATAIGEGGEKEPLLREVSTSSSTSSSSVYTFVTKHGYSTSPLGLATIVSEQQLGALEAFGGVEGLAIAILSSAGITTTTTSSSSKNLLNLKDGLPSNDDDGDDNDDGDDESVIAALKRTYGSNALPLPSAPNLVELIIAALSDPTMCMLLASACVSLILGLGIEGDYEKGWIEGTSIAVTVCLVVSVAAGTDYSKAQEFRQQQIQLESTKHIHIIRQQQGDSAATNENGEEQEDTTATAATTAMQQQQNYHPSELVVGDVVRLAVGDICPADGVLFQASHDLKLDESALTGETELVKKSIWKSTSPASANNNNSSTSPPRKDTANNSNNSNKNDVDPFIVSGTNVMQGSGLFMVLAVGSNSIQGKILARIREQQHDSDDANGDDDDTNSKQQNGCCTAIKAFFTFGGGEDTAGATLMEKLDSLAVDIGKMGIIVALLVFIVMLTQWIYKEFIIDETCAPLLDEHACLATAETCHVTSLSSSLSLSSGDAFKCARHFDTVHDIKTILDYFITAITILVVAVPEGLPLAVTLALAVSMRRMMKDANQVKNMDSTETMGSATTICSDKTGTLTENKMTAMKICYAGALYEHIVGNEPKSSSSDRASLGSILKEKLGGGNAKTRHLAEAILLNTSPTSKVMFKKDDSTEEEVVVYQGNPTECALIKLTAQLGFDANKVRAAFTDAGSMLDWGVYNIPFSSERKKMSWIVQQQSKAASSSSPDHQALPYFGQYRLYSKGAPRQVLDACSFIVTGINDQGIDQKEPLSLEKKQSIMDLVASWQDKGLRTLAIAYRDIKEKPTTGWDHSAGAAFEADMSLLAVVGIEDPLRASVPQAIAECHKAGIDVRMCTGDALSTAIAIAKGCRILRETDLDTKTGLPKNGFAMTGAEFDDRVHRKDPKKAKIIRRVFDPNINDAVDSLADPFLLDDAGNKVLDQKAFDDLWPTLRVLARCQPEDKLTLVRGMRKSKVFLDEARCAKLYSEHGIRIFPDYQVVAVTGDGTNDAPAMKSANVGFAMGIAGTETAKQACDIILLDDNFASIIKAVMWGRNVFDSISKFIQFQLTVNVVAITLAVIGAFTYNESPLSAVQMLWVNMIMDSLASLALATERPTKELLDRMPYGKRRPVISPIMCANIIGHSVYQISILCWVLFKPETLPIDPPVAFEPSKGSLNWSVFFNVFVMLQLFNELNARRLPTAEKLRTSLSEWNIFQGICTNPNFVVIMVATFSLQILMMEYGGEAVNVVPGGITTSQWMFCVGAGAGSLVWQLFINAAVALFAPTQDEEMKKTKKLTPAKIEEEEAAEAVVVAEAAPEAPGKSKWDLVRHRVRRDILYSKVLGASVRRGHKLSTLILQSTAVPRRSDVYYKMLGKQLRVHSKKKQHDLRSSSPF